MHNFLEWNTIASNWIYVLPRAEHTLQRPWCLQLFSIPLFYTMDSSCFARTYSIFPSHLPVTIRCASVENTNISTGGETTLTHDTRWCVLFIFDSFHFFFSFLSLSMLFASIVNVRMVVVWWNCDENYGIFSSFVFVCLFQLTATASHICFTKSVWSFGCKTLAWTVHIVLSSKIDSNIGNQKRTEEKKRKNHVKLVTPKQVKNPKDCFPFPKKGK